MTETTLRVKGMTCSSCVASVESAVSNVSGVESVRVNLALEKANITWLIVGPEGGWTSAERDALDNHSVAPIHLGGSILRTSTAAVAGAVELVRWRDQQLNS